MLGDFGFATSGKNNKFFLGTPKYMAPEIWKGECYTKAVDMWALGVVYYQLLTGEYPYPCVKNTSGANIDEQKEIFKNYQFQPSRQFN